MEDLEGLKKYHLRQIEKLEDQIESARENIETIDRALFLLRKGGTEDEGGIYFGKTLTDSIRDVLSENYPEFFYPREITEKVIAGGGRYKTKAKLASSVRATLSFFYSRKEAEREKRGSGNVYRLKKSEAP